jgi:hypothetical protein
MGAIPVRPSRQLLQKAFFPTPQAEIIPMPVTTISSIKEKLSAVSYQLSARESSWTRIFAVAHG